MDVRKAPGEHCGEPASGPDPGPRKGHQQRRSPDRDRSRGPAPAPPTSPRRAPSGHVADGLRLLQHPQSGQRRRHGAGANQKVPEIKTASAAGRSPSRPMATRGGGRWPATCQSRPGPGRCRTGTWLPRGSSRNPARISSRMSSMPSRSQIWRTPSQWFPRPTAHLPRQSPPSEFRLLADLGLDRGRVHGDYAGCHRISVADCSRCRAIGPTLWQFVDGRPSGTIRRKRSLDGNLSLNALPASQCRASTVANKEHSAQRTRLFTWSRLFKLRHRYNLTTTPLLYVAMTRARDRLYLTCSRGRASRFLSDVPREYLKRE